MKSVLITSSILILLLAALRPLLRGRIDPRLQYALWLIIALRLLVPVELATSAYSALALLDRAEGPARAAQAIGRTHVPIPAQSYDSAYVQVIREYEENGVDTTQLSDRELEQVDAQARERSQGATLAQLFEKYARPVWLGGTALAGLWFLLVNLRFRRRLRAAELAVTDPSTKLPVYVSDALLSPCLCGTFRPAIYITPHAVQDPDRLRHVLAHESTHYRHKDHWWALVRCLCLCLYWFDPLVWWAAALSRQDCELACDAGAIRRLGEAERIPYGRTLVDMIAAGRCSLMQTATTMTGGRRRVRERVRLIARKPKTVIAVALALVLVLGAAVGCTFTGAPEASQKPETATLDNLQERLMDLPKQLQDTVTTVTGSGSLVEYRLDVPADWEDEHYAYVLSVRSFQKEGFHAFPESGEDILWEIAAQDDTCYYVIHRLREQTYPSEYEYWNAHRTVRTFVEETLLATEGVEPYAGQGTLRTRLNNVPLELQADVITGPGHDDSPTLVTYWMNRDWTNKDNSGLGFLLRVEQMSQAELDEHRDTGGWECFARNGGTYFVITYATDVRFYSPDDAEPFHNAFDAIRAYAMEQVLATDGVEPFDPGTTPPPSFSNVPQPPLEPGSYAIDGMDYTLVTSYAQLPEDPEQWYLVGQLPGNPVWMFTRGYGHETMFQVEDQLTQVFPYTACFFGGGQTHDGHAPQLMPLDGFGSGPNGTFGPFAVITHIFQGGLDQMYQLTVYDLGTDAVTPYVHDWDALMNDFNQTAAVQFDSIERTAYLSYGGHRAELKFDEAQWDVIQQNHSRPQVYDTDFSYSFNHDGAANLDMTIWTDPSFAPSYTARWTIRFTGNGFETTGFCFVQSVYP